MEVSPYYKIKVLVCGSMSVGKSSLVWLVRNETPRYDSEPTIGLDFACTHIELEEYPLSNPSNLPDFYFQAKKEIGIGKENEHLQLIQVHIWDASGSVRFSSIVKMYYRDVDICLLVFDMTDRSSWDELSKWKEQVLNEAKAPHFPIFVLVGNKSDLRPHQVSMKEIKERAEQWGVKYYVLSAVQDSSSSMVRRMIYMSVQNFHDNMLLLSHDKKALPPHVTIPYQTKKNNFIDIDVASNPSYCCYQ